MSNSPMRSMPGILETQRLRLRPLEASDDGFILRLLNDPSWLRFIGDRNVRTLRDARSYIERGPQRMYREQGFGLLLVERAADSTPMGLCGLIRRDTLPDVDIGFALMPEYWGHGYAFEAAAATLRHAREVLRLPRVVAIVLPENVASTRLLERLGLRLEGAIRLGGDTEELSLYGTTAAFSLDAENVCVVDDALWTSGQLSAADIARLPTLGIEAVVNLALPTSPNALAGEAEAISALGLTYVQIPVPWEQPGLQHLRQFFGVMDALAGRRVWVHCARNMRVSAFIYLYRRLRRGEPEEVACHPMREVWEPNDTWREFIGRALENWDASR